MTGARKKQVVWIINPQHWPRACLRAELLERGFEAVGFLDVSHALAELSHPLRAKPVLMIIELCDLILDQDQIAALSQFEIPMIAMGGVMEFKDPLVISAKWAAGIQRPFSIGAVADKVERFLDETNRRAL